MAFIEPLFRWLLASVDLTFFLLSSLALFLSLYLCKQLSRTRRLPPGPWGYPVMGILPKIKKPFHELLEDFSKVYGNIFSCKMGQATVVVLSDYESIKKAFGSRDFVARPKSELSHLLNGYGVINSDGDLWKSHRRYLINQKLGIRNHSWKGSGLQQVESIVKREVVTLLKDIGSDFQAKPFNPALMFNSAVSNVICSMIMSTRFSHDDPQFQRFMFLFDEGFRLFLDTGYTTFIPVLKYLPGAKTTVQKLQENRAEMLLFVRNIIQSHRDTLDAEKPRDLVDSYLVKIAELRREERQDELFHGFEPEQQLEQVILDLFSAGVETLKTSLLWAVLYMLHNPEVLARVRGELDAVVGAQRLPEIDDMERLPYTRATLCEVLRRSSVVPMATTHSTERDVDFCGFTIPANAHVIPLLHAVHMNPEVWPQPEQFRPERFLSEDGAEVVKPKHFMPFGVGHRMCLGDQLAEKEFFLFFASLVHTFELSAPAGPAGKALLPDLKGVSGVTLTPKEFQVVCRPRRRSNAADSMEEEDIVTDLTGAQSSRTYG